MTVVSSTDEDEGALLDEALCRGEADAGSATGDHGGLSIQSVHDVHFFLEKKGGRAACPESGVFSLEVT